MGRTYRRNGGFKKDRRDKNFNRSRKFKEWEKPHKHHQNPNVLSADEITKFPEELFTADEL